MSLMRLLTNGKTLVDVKRSTSRYQIPTKSLLPKFGPVKNPFTPPVSPAPRPASSPVVAAAVEPKPAVKIAAEALTKTQKLPAVAVKMKETRRIPFVAARHFVPPTATGLKWWERFLDWAGLMLAKPGQWWQERQRPATAAIPRFDKPVVQGELSLENIKVVRNDLNDADLDVVPAKTFTGETNFKPALQPQANRMLAMTESPVA